MKKYFYTDGSEQYGPFTLEELKEKGIQSSTNVWYEGLADWVVADSIPDLKDLFPPTRLNASISEKKQSETSDNKRIKTDRLLFFALLYWAFYELLNVVLYKVLPFFYDDNLYLVVNFFRNLIFVAVPIIVASSIIDQSLRKKAMILAIVISFSTVFFTLFYSFF